MQNVVIVSAVRTPVGSFGGTLKTIGAVQLGAITVKEALKRANVAPEAVDELIFGCVLQGGQGQNVARQVCLGADLPIEVPAMTINKVCGSGLRAVSLGAQIIKAGDADIIVFAHDRVVVLAVAPKLVGLTGVEISAAPVSVIKRRNIVRSAVAVHTKDC